MKKYFVSILIALTVFTTGCVTMHEVKAISCDEVIINDEIIQSMQEVDEFKRLRLPDARGTFGDCYSTVVELGIMDNFVCDTEISEVSFLKDMDELNKKVNSIDWNRKISRGEYAHIINQIRKLISLPKYECCMGNTPNLEGIEDYKYFNDVKECAYNGLYCTRETNNPDDIMKVRELYKYLWKWVNSEPDCYTNLSKKQTFDMWKDYINANYSSDETIYGSLWKESQITLDMLQDLDVSKFLRRDYLNRINLDNDLTVGDLVSVLTNAMDYHMAYKELSKTGSNCTPCAMLGVEKYYVDLIKSDE